MMIYSGVSCFFREWGSLSFQVKGWYIYESAESQRSWHPELIHVHSPKKRNSSPFHLRILKWPDGVQERSRSHFYAYTLATLSLGLGTLPKKDTPQCFKIQVEQAWSFFFWIVYILSVQYWTITKNYRLVQHSRARCKDCTFGRV